MKADLLKQKVKLGPEWCSIPNSWVLEQSLIQLLDPDYLAGFFFAKHITRKSSNYKWKGQEIPI